MVSGVTSVIPNGVKYVRIGHVTGSSRVFLYDFGSYTIIQLAVVPRTSVVAIKCSRFSLSVS